MMATRKTRDTASRAQSGSVVKSRKHRLKKKAYVASLEQRNVSLARDVDGMKLEFETHDTLLTLINARVTYLDALVRNSEQLASTIRAVAEAVTPVHPGTELPESEARKEFSEESSVMENFCMHLSSESVWADACLECRKSAR